MHETYYANHSNTTYEVDSLSKTCTAQLAGIAVTQGLISLDVPIAKYGVDVGVVGKWGKNITLRHIPSQTSGKGKVTPGT